MERRAIRLITVMVAMSLLVACASAGRSETPLRTAPARPVVTNPAPVVSGTMRRYQVRGRWYQPMQDAAGYDEEGIASWYGDQFNGRPTATGEIFDMHGLSAAHKTLPLPGLVEVTNLANGRTIVLRVNDRGPFVDDRIIDLSRGAAQELGLLSQGVGRVRVRYLGLAPRGGGTGMGAGAQQAAAAPEPFVQAETGVFWVQAGAFSQRNAAERIADRLGDRARVQQVDGASGRLFRVVIGPWDDPNSAEEGRQAVIARGYPDALLISGG
jgi:rare lipoprotein A